MNSVAQNISIGDDAVSVDLCKLTMSSGKAAIETIEKWSGNDPLSKNIFHYGYSLGYHDFIIATKLTNMNELYDRSLLDELELHITSHHRFFIFSFMNEIKNNGGKENLLFGKNAFFQGNDDQCPISLMILLKMNYALLSKVFGSEKNFGFSLATTSCVDYLFKMLEQSRCENLIGGFGIGGTLGMHNLAVFLRGNSIKSLLSQLADIKGLNVVSTLEIENEYSDYPIFESSFSIPSINYNVKDINNIADDNIALYLRMSAAPGSNIGYEDTIKEKLSLNECYYTLGKTDFMGCNHNITFRDYYAKLKDFLEKEKLDIDSIKNLMWATDSSVCIPNNMDTTREKKNRIFYKNLIEERDLRKRLIQSTKDARFIKRESSLNKTSSIGYLARYDIDRFAYSDMIPFLRKGWFHHLTLNIVEEVIRNTDDFIDNYLPQYNKDFRLSEENREIPSKDYEEDIVLKSIEKHLLKAEEMGSIEKNEKDGLRGQYADLIKRRIESKDTLKPFGKEFDYDLDAVIKQLEDYHRVESDIYMETISTLQVARLQRYWGTKTSFHTFIHNPANFECGIHLLLHGLGSLVYEIFESINSSDRMKLTKRFLTWCGFFNVDPNPKNIILLKRLNIISIPLHELLSITRLINDIIHEAAHAVLISTGIDDLIRFGGPDKPRNKRRNVIIETFCDIFVYNYGYRGDLNRYFQWMPETFVPLYRTSTIWIEGLIRLFGVYLYSKMMKIYNNRDFLDKWRTFNVEAAVLEFAEILEKMSNKEGYSSLSIIYEKFCAYKKNAGDNSLENELEKRGRNIRDLLHEFALDKVEIGDGENTAPLVEIFGNQMSSKRKFRFTEDIKNIVEDANLSKWNEFLTGFSEKEYKTIKDQLSHEFIFALTDFIRSDNKGVVGIKHRCMAVLVTFDISMRNKYWERYKDKMGVIEEIT